MEPLDCVIRLSAGECDLWVGSQSQTLDQMAVAAAAGLPPAKVRLHTMLAGGSFGRRSTPRSAELVEAVSIARGAGRRAADQGGLDPRG
jgi:isoquinoline 1-oxidoreductase beta subunit